MSDKENDDITDDYKCTKIYSSTSNISSAVTSLVNDVLENALEFVNNDISEHHSVGSAALSIVNNVLGEALDTLDRESPAHQRTSSAARSIVEHAISGAYNTLNQESLTSEESSISELPIDSKIERRFSQDTMEISEREAFTLVDRAINSAVRIVENDIQEELKECIKFEAVELSEKQFKLAIMETPVANIKWPTIGKFDEFVGERKIAEFIMTWKLGYDWLHCITFLGVLETRYDMRYKYRARFSLPTRERPIPMATVSVYFTIVASKIKPSDFIVEVFYVIESMQLVHRPGEYIFCDLWLRRILDQKTALRQMVDF